jgi:peptide-methionine (S)-S-oxide reductase
MQTRAPAILAAAAASFTSTASAFFGSTSGVVFGSAISSRTFFASASPTKSGSGSNGLINADGGSSATSSSSYSTTATRANLFSSLGAFNPFSSNADGSDVTIDYSSLKFPGNEMGEAAANNEIPSASKSKPELSIATFASGCFWGVELAFQRVPGVVETAAGYTHGNNKFPLYNAVCSGTTGHTEAVQVYYDPTVVDFDQLLDVFFSRTDPTTVNGQGNDYGSQYRTGVYTHSEEQMEKSRSRFTKEMEGKYKGRTLATELKPAQVFWPAEQYHMQYLSNGGRAGSAQSAEKGCTDRIRCYG